LNGEADEQKKYCIYLIKKEKQGAEYVGGKRRRREMRTQVLMLRSAPRLLTRMGHVLFSGKNPSKRLC